MKGHYQTTVELRELAKKFQKQRRREYPGVPGCLPRSVPKDKRRVIVHNQVQHTVDTTNGENGFRCWTQLKTSELVSCKCGWAGLPHYRMKRLARLIAADLEDYS